MNRDVIICRCEDVTYGEIVDAIDEGLATTEEIKRILRCGMGPCQGRTCYRLIARIIAEKTGGKVADVPYPAVRPPSRPVEIGTLAEPGIVNVGALRGTSDEE
ncbi:MAG: (2Fe-2S)-binding protein [Candidatus Eisenbacteria sp.]|nr:(2Fe-2S)-binding protein [Candidatus Eisenbacteria bacterium]